MLLLLPLLLHCYYISLSNCPYGCCACYYGADGGARGVPGYTYMWCYNNHCWNKQMIAYPGGLVNGKGGWLPGNQCENSGCGYCLMHWAVTNYTGAVDIVKLTMYLALVVLLVGLVVVAAMVRTVIQVWIRISYKYDENL